MCIYLVQMTMEEAEALSKSYTQKALAGLRDHLKEHPAQLELMVDRFREGGKKEEAQLVNRFANGKYPGVPYTVDGADGDGEAGKRRAGWGSGWFGGWWAGLAVVLSVGSLAVMAGVLLSSGAGDE